MNNDCHKHSPILLRTFIGVLVLLTSLVQAGTPTNQVRQTTDKVLEVLTQPELKGEEKAEEKHAKVRRIVDKRFDWEAMCKRALGRHWRGKSQKQRSEFIELFGALLEKRYMDKIDNYSGQEVMYQDERVDDGYAEVDVAIITKPGKEIDVRYRMHKASKQENEWTVYDIVIEGVSLVNNYRSQFNSILNCASFDELLEKLRAKQE